LCGSVRRAEVIIGLSLPGQEWEVNEPAPKSTRIYCSNWLSCGLGWGEPAKRFRALGEQVNAIVAERLGVDDPEE